MLLETIDEFGSQHGPCPPGFYCDAELVDHWSRFVDAAHQIKLCAEPRDTRQRLLNHASIEDIVDAAIYAAARWFSLVVPKGTSPVGSP